MKPSRVRSVLDRLFDTRWSAFIWGPPGAGKSSIVRAIASERGVPMIDVRALLLDPTDLRGIPTVEKGLARWCPPSFLPTPDDTPGILFFDELNAAPPLVQASLYQLVLDRRVGEYALPDGWRIVAAGNRAEDASVTFRMPAALANRFVHIDFEIDFDDWRVWAVDAGVHPLVIGFLGTRRELLFDMARPERGFPTPRSWEILSDTLKAFGSVRDADDILIGIVGEGAAIEFIGYCQDAITEELVRAILADPANAPLPAKLADQYALISYIASDAKSAATRRAAGVLLQRLRPELAVLLLRDILRAHPSFGTTAAAREFLTVHGSLLV